MGLRGPAPTPTAINKMRGNPGKRKRNHAEPQPGEFRAKPPDHLDEYARKEWKRLVPILKRMDVLRDADYLALASLCIASSALAHAQSEVNRLGDYVKGPDGSPIKNPARRIVNEQIAIVNQLSREFGLTPSSRTRIQVAPAAPAESKWSRLANMRTSEQAG